MSNEVYMSRTWPLLRTLVEGTLNPLEWPMLYPLSSQPATEKIEAFLCGRVLDLQAFGCTRNIIHTSSLPKKRSLREVISISTNHRQVGCPLERRSTREQVAEPEMYLISVI
ncbi:hypothetical protein OG21DRAFT_1243123 [Imleria badia]|nr:hypothetical protein OG21DRAFT_1243123 [Imleria badia]